MKPGVLIGLVFLILAGAGAVGWSLMAAIGKPLRADPFPVPGGALVLPPERAGAFDSVIIQRNVFRPARRPARLAYDRSRPAPSTPAVQLALIGIVTGNRPSALIEGLPGANGPRVLWRDEEMGVYRLVSVGTDSAVLKTPDGTVVLKLKGVGP